MKRKSEKIVLEGPVILGKRRDGLLEVTYYPKTATIRWDIKDIDTWSGPSLYFGRLMEKIDWIKKLVKKLRAEGWDTDNNLGCARWVTLKPLEHETAQWIASTFPKVFKEVSKKIEERYRSRSLAL
jgi:hypothetical protein